MSKEAEEYSKRLAEACRHAGVPFDPTPLGDFIGVNKQTAANWINGTSLPSLPMHYKLSYKLNVDSEWLGIGDGPPPGTPLQSERQASVTKSTRRTK